LRNEVVVEPGIDGEKTFQKGHSHSACHQRAQNKDTDDLLLWLRLQLVHPIEKAQPECGRHEAHQQPQEDEQESVQIVINTVENQIEEADKDQQADQSEQRRDPKSPPVVGNVFGVGVIECAVHYGCRLHGLPPTGGFAGQHTPDNRWLDQPDGPIIPEIGEIETACLVGSN
jgi:hypothetical protein